MTEILQLLASGFLVVFQPQNLMLIIAGCALGLFIGAMPGLGSVNGVAIILPLTFLVPPTGAIIFLAAISIIFFKFILPIRMPNHPLRRNLKNSSLVYSLNIFNKIMPCHKEPIA